LEENQVSFEEMKENVRRAFDALNKEDLTLLDGISGPYLGDDCVKRRPHSGD
jgi:hypothetical protein